MKSPRLLAILVLVAATACGRTDSPAPAAPSADFDGWADGFAEEWVRASPQMATRSQYFSGAEQDGLDRQLSMIGEWDWTFGSKALADRAAQARRGLEALDRFNTASLTPQQRTSAAVIRWSLEDAVRLGGVSALPLRLRSVQWFPARSDQRPDAVASHPPRARCRKLPRTADAGRRAGRRGDRGSAGGAGCGRASAPRHHPADDRTA